MKLTIRLKGGAGSGHHGHKGRPGEQGGSLPQGSSASAVSATDKYPIKTKYGSLDKSSLIRVAHTQDGDYDIHKRSGHAIIVSPDGSIRESGINTGTAEQFVYRFMSPKIEVAKPVVSVDYVAPIAWNGKSVFTLSAIVKARYNKFDYTKKFGTDKNFYDSVKKLFDDSNIKLSDGDWDELGQYFDAWVPDKFEG